jgi:hypothetical protein
MRSMYKYEAGLSRMHRVAFGNNVIMDHHTESRGFIASKSLLYYTVYKPPGAAKGA